MRKTVLIVTCESFPNPNRPASGGMIRIWSLAEGLKQRGFNVLFSVPKEKLFDDDTASIKKLAHEYKDITLKVSESGCDVVLVEQWGTATYLDDLGIPFVIDLHGSLTLENLYRPSTSPTSDAYTKIETFAKADMLVCPNSRQKDYFTAWLLMSGRDITKGAIEIIPISLPPNLPKKVKSKELKIVYGGTMWPWIDPFPGIEILAKKLQDTKKGVLEIYVAPPKDETLQNRFKEFQKRLSGYKSVRFYGHLPRNELIKRYSSAAFAFDLHAFNLERYYASITRTYEYLWCGLPVVYPDYGELANKIENNNAGFCVNPSDANLITETIDSILKAPSALSTMGANAQKFVSKNFTWTKTVEPLARFVAKPFHLPAPKNIVATLKENYSQIWSKEIKELEKRIKEYELRFIRELSEKEAELETRQKVISQLQERITRFEDELHRRNMKIEELTGKGEEIEHLWQKKWESAWAEFKSEIEHHKKLVRERDAAIAELNKESNRKIRELAREWEKQLKQKDKEINNRDKKLEDLSQLCDKKVWQAQQEKEEALKERDKIQSEMQAKIDALNTSWDQKVWHVQKERDEIVKERDKIQAEMQAKLDALNTSWNEKLWQVQKEKGEEIKERDQQLKELNKSWGKRVELLEIEKQALIKDRDKVQVEMQAKIDALNTSWDQKVWHIQKERGEIVKERDKQSQELNKNWTKKLESAEQEKQRLVGERDLHIQELNKSWGKRVELLEIEKQSLVKDRDKVQAEMQAKIDALNTNWSERVNQAQSERNELAKERDRQLQDMNASWSEKYWKAEKEKQEILMNRDELVRRANERIEEIQKDWAERLGKLEVEKSVINREKERLAYEFPLKLAELTVNWETKLTHRELEIQRLKDKIEEVKRAQEEKLAQITRAFEEQLSRVHLEKGGLQAEIDRLNHEQSELVARFEAEISKREMELKQLEQDVEGLFHQIRRLKESAQPIPLVSGELARFHNVNLEIFKSIQEKERALTFFQERYGKSSWLFKRRTKKLLSLYPRIAWLWLVNVLTNAYMEWWQRRRKALIFPGHVRLKRGDKE